ncbi:MAG: YdbH domain-containing protein [Rickettsiales bacterium]|nr:YdbH domain-containing protein [Rickettsiales bacterium]
MMKFLKYIGMIALLLGIGGALCFMFLPWQNWAQEWISQRLRAQGIPITQLHLKDITLTHADFSDIRLEMGTPLVIPTLRIEYTKDNLFEQKLDHVELRGIDYQFDLPAPSEGKEHAIMLPAPALLRQLPVEHITVADSRIRVINDSLNISLPFDAEISRSGKVMLSVKGKEAKATLGKQDKVAAHNWQLNVSAKEEEWHVAMDVGSLDLKLATPVAKQAPAQGKDPSILRLPEVRNVEMTALNFSHVNLDYTTPEYHVITVLAANLAPDGKSLSIKGKTSSITSPTEAITLPDWHAKVIWPKQEIRVQKIVVNGASIALQSENTKPSTLAYPLPKQLTRLPLDSLRFRNSTLMAGFSDGNFTTTFDGELYTSPTPSIKIEAKQGALTLAKAHYQLVGLSTQLKAVKNHWKITADIQTISSNPKEEKLWLPLSIKANGKIFADKITVSAKAKHPEFSVNSDASYNGLKTELLAPTLTLAGGKIFTSHIDLSEEDISSKITFNNVSLEALLQLVLKDEKSVHATGRLSGIVPVRYHKGKLELGSGKLESTTSGLLSLGEEHLGILPQNIEQTRQVAQLLKHFEYNSLELTTDQEHEKLALKVALKGRNPQVYDGAEVHLNINLRGDVLETLSSALGLYDLPERYLKGTANAR